MSVRLQLLVGWPIVSYGVGDRVDTVCTPAAVHQRVKAMIDHYYAADASMESNLGNRQVIVRLDCDGSKFYDYELLWKRMLAAAKNRPVT